MHALAEPPVSPTVVGAEERDGLARAQRRVVVRLRDGETIVIGGSPSYEDALVLAQKTILRLAEVGVGDAGDRFIDPDAIVSVDVLRRLQRRETGPAGLMPGRRLVPSPVPPTGGRWGMTPSR